MAISAERFEFALKNLDPSQWRPFEQLASVFLSSEFPNLRPVASMSGDGGADALLFQPEGDNTVVIQYSVRKDVSTKISETCKRIKEVFPAVKILVYVTNQPLGGKTVEYSANVRTNHHLHLDARGLEWLVQVRNSTSATQAEAEELSAKIVDPLVGDSGKALSQQAQALEDLEAKAAFVYLGLQWRDDTRDKGLTKLCFEALVRSVLRETTSDDRMSRQDVHRLVAELLPGQHKRIMGPQVDGALSRLNKRLIRHWQKPDEFCLTWDERVRLATRLTELELLDDALRIHLREALRTSITEIGGEPIDANLDQLVDLSRSVIEKVLLNRGEAFAISVARDRGGDVRTADIEAVLATFVSRKGATIEIPNHILAATLQSILVAPPEDVRKFLRSLADTYTLFAFMRETPDVQSAVVKLFSEGDIWLDTSVVLPLLAEDLLDPSDRSHSELLASATECGLKLFITEGVLEELVTHVNRCRSYLRAQTREGAHGWPPFLLNSHRLSGNDDDFENWLENFCGSDPSFDLQEYLEDEHSISLKPLSEFAEGADLNLRAAVAEVWHASRDAREKRHAFLGIPPMDTTTRDKLVGHDVENYVGVVERRRVRNERRSAFGYRTWWLTLDRTAFRVHSELRQTLPDPPAAAPSISPDFMLNYLAIGPVRSRLSRRSESTLPLMLNMSVLDAVPKELLEFANELREELAGRNPRIVRRKIKETLEDARRLMGPTAQAGEAGLTEEIKARLIRSAKERP